MNVTLNYLGQLRHIAGVEAERIECPDSALLTHVLKDVSTRHEGPFAKILLDDADRLRPSVMILVNEVPIGKGSVVELHDGDQVTLLPAIAGG